MILLPRHNHPLLFFFFRNPLKWKTLSTKERSLLSSRTRDISVLEHKIDSDVVAEEKPGKKDDSIGDGHLPLDQRYIRQIEKELEYVVKQSKYQTVIRFEEEHNAHTEQSLKELKVTWELCAGKTNPNGYSSDDLETAIRMSLAEGIPAGAAGATPVGGECRDGAAEGVARDGAAEGVATPHEAWTVVPSRELSKPASVCGARPRCPPVPSPQTGNGKSHGKKKKTSTCSPSTGSPSPPGSPNLYLLLEDEGLEDEEEAQLRRALQLSQEDSGPRRWQPSSLATPGQPSPLATPGLPRQQPSSLATPGLPSQQATDFPSLLATSSYSGQLAWALEASQEATQPLGGLDSMLSVLTLEEHLELALRLSTAGAGQGEGNTVQAKARPVNTIEARPVNTIKARPVQSIDAMPVQPAVAVQPTGLRLVVIDGMNVAMAHGVHRTFSVRGLVLAMEFFRQRGHEVVIFLPTRKWTAANPEDRKILDTMERNKILFLVQNKDYNDQVIIKHADINQGVILSNDRYRDVLLVNPEFTDQIRNR